MFFKILLKDNTLQTECHSICLQPIMVSGTLVGMYSVSISIKLETLVVYYFTNIIEIFTFWKLLGAFLGPL